jgi:UDP-2-acetamido-3-amino-2,3-dideoxy-glucuronate N-acetyltransferase
VPAIIHPSCTIEQGATVGDQTKIWQHAHVRRGAVLGRNCIIGNNVFVDVDVVIGDCVKVQNNASVYQGSRIGDGVFIGPHVILANDTWPRAVTADGTLKDHSHWTVNGATVDSGASIGAGTVVLPGVHVGAWAMIGAASVVTTSLPAHALAYGSPCRVVSFICRCTQVVAGSFAALDWDCLQP